MPRRQIRNDALYLLSSNSIISHIGGRDGIITAPLRTLTNPDGTPNFAFMKKCHDEYHSLVLRYPDLALPSTDVTHYGVFAEGVLAARVRFRQQYREVLIPEEDVEHPDVTEVARMYLNHEVSSLRAAAAIVNARRADRTTIA